MQCLPPEANPERRLRFEGMGEKGKGEKGKDQESADSGLFAFYPFTLFAF